MTFALHSENMTIASTLLLTNAPEGIAMQQFAQLFLVTGLGFLLLFVFYIDMNIQKKICDIDCDPGRMFGKLEHVCK